mmetsp:Transcript_470/g.946  ORF Transcript_470/g.946 Transcript_470/m.946 type:complete len:445 (+) Transcript_470:241-1575(+)
MRSCCHCSLAASRSRRAFSSNSRRSLVRRVSSSRLRATSRSLLAVSCSLALAFSCSVCCCFFALALSFFFLFLLDLVALLFSSSSSSLMSARAAASASKATASAPSMPPSPPLMATASSSRSSLSSRRPSPSSPRPPLVSAPLPAPAPLRRWACLRRSFARCTFDRSREHWATEAWCRCTIFKAASVMFFSSRIQSAVLPFSSCTSGSAPLSRRVMAVDQCPALAASSSAERGGQTSSKGAPRWARRRATSSRPLEAAADMGDQPPLEQMHGLPPRSSRAATTLVCPPSRAASTRGVSPCLLSASTGAPQSSNKVTTRAFPGRQPMQARCSGVPHSSEHVEDTRVAALVASCAVRALWSVPLASGLAPLLQAKVVRHARHARGRPFSVAHARCARSSAGVSTLRGCPAPSSRSSTSTRTRSESLKRKPWSTTWSEGRKSRQPHS